jgi:hypothetical protein
MNDYVCEVIVRVNAAIGHVTRSDASSNISESRHVYNLRRDGDTTFVYDNV